MNHLSSLDLVLRVLGYWGQSVLAIVTAVIAVGLGYLVYRFGWGKVKTSLGVAEFDFAKAKELETFFSKRGHNSAVWDWGNLHKK